MKTLIVVLVIGIALGFALSVSTGELTGLFVHRAIGIVDVQPVFSPDNQAVFVNAVRGASSSIELEVYTFSSTVLADELAGAVGRGVDVKVILDRSIESNFKTSRILLARGVKVKWSPSVFERTHSKFIVIDNETVIVGSNNWTFHSFNLNREAGVKITSGEVAVDFLNIFYSDWSLGVEAS